jgi:hypothetical protein
MQRSKFRSEASSQVQAAPGTNAVYEKNPLKRPFRDIQVARTSKSSGSVSIAVSRSRFSERITPCHRDAQ